MKHKKILLVDQDPLMVKMVWENLQSAGFLTYHADSLKTALGIASRISFDFFILETTIDYENDGYFLAQTLREQFPNTPLLLINDERTEDSITSSFENGADQLLQKPFSGQLLKTTIVHTLNRYEQLLNTKAESDPPLKGIFSFDERSHLLYKKGQSIELSSKEADLIRFFLEHPNQVLPKKILFFHIWNKTTCDENLIKVYINRLRHKIEDNPKEPFYLKTVWGVGYIFNPGN